MNELCVLVYVLKAAGIIYYGYVALWLAISLKLCCTSSLVYCVSTPSTLVPVSSAASKNISRKVHACIIICTIVPLSATLYTSASTIHCDIDYKVFNQRCLINVIIYFELIFFIVQILKHTGNLWSKYTLYIMYRCKTYWFAFLTSF